MSRRSICIFLVWSFFIGLLVLSSTWQASAVSPKHPIELLGKKASPSNINASTLSQAQNNLPYPSWWNGTVCDTTKVSNSTPLGAYYRGVPACGPIGLPTDSTHEVLFPNGFGEYEWQCVEFSMRFMYLAYGIPAYDAPTGTNVVDNYQQHNNNPILIPIQNTNPSTTDTVPQPGDILSYYSNHTAVVSKTKVDSSGNGTLTVIEQNFHANGTDTIKVGSNAGLPGWVLDTSKIKNWLHHTVDITPQTSFPTAKVNISGSGFGANETVNITFDNVNSTILVGTTTASSTGTISTTVSIPQSAQPDGHAIHVIGQTSGHSPQTIFYVQTNWPTFGYNTQATRFNTYENAVNPSNVSNLVVGWSGMTGNAIASSPAVSDGVVYIGSGDSYLYAFASTCGTGGVACLPLWKGSTGAQIESSPAVYNGVVYVASYNGTLYAFNASGCGQPTCSPLWTANIGNSTTSSPVISNGIIYIGSSAGILYVFKASGCGNPTCLPIWTGTYYGSNNSSPVVANGIVYIGDVVKLYAFNAAGCGQSTCSPLWTADTGTISSWPTVVNGLLYIGSQDHHLYVFNAGGCGQSTCQPVWTAITGSLIISAPAVARGVVYIGSTDNMLYAFNANGCGQSTCSPIWTANLGEAIVSAPAVANGVIYIGSYSGFYAFNASGCGNSICSPLWTANVGGFGTTSSPAVVNGWVYNGSTDDHIYAFHLPS